MNSPVFNEDKSNACNSLPAGIQECRELVERISRSAAFHRSARLRELLLYVGDRTLSGRVDELTEGHIGVQVFGRPEGFNPGDDSIVRVTARQLRTRLTEYFTSEGREESIGIEIPKGSYVAVFTPRLVAPPLPEPELAPPPAIPPPRPARQLLLGALCLSTLLSVAAGVWLWFNPRSLVPKPHDTLARFLLTSGPQRTVLVLTDTGLVIAQKITGEAPGVEKYASGEYLQRQESEFARRGVTDLAKHLSLTQHTGMADAAIYGRLLHTNPDLMDRILLRHARGVSSRDIQAGNTILIGGPGANPWARAFADRMNFALGHDSATNTTYILNKNPQPGEPARYSSPFGSELGFCGVQMLRNRSTGGLTLLLGGTHMEAKEAAGDFITDPAAFQNLLQRMNRTSLDGVSRLEVLLQSRKLAGSSQGWQVIAHRVTD